MASVFSRDLGVPGGSRARTEEGEQGSEQQRKETQAGIVRNSTNGGPNSALSALSPGYSCTAAAKKHPFGGKRSYSVASKVVLLCLFLPRARARVRELYGTVRAL